MNEFFL